MIALQPVFLNGPLCVLPVKTFQNIRDAAYKGKIQVIGAVALIVHTDQEGV